MDQQKITQGVLEALAQQRNQALDAVALMKGQLEAAIARVKELEAALEPKADAAE